MNWFNPSKPASESLCSDFDHYAYFPSDRAADGRNAAKQIEWSLARIAECQQPYFLFLNLGETHHPYTAAGHDYSADWGDAAKCALAQRASLEYLDRCLAELFSKLENCFAVICGDHGDCWGENDLWGHAFYHPSVLSVPMVVLDRRDKSFLGNCLSYIYPAA